MKDRVRTAISILLLCGSLLPGLSACVSPEEIRRRDEAQCRGYGFKPGTTEFAACLQRENLTRRYGFGYTYPYPYYAYP